VKAIVLLGSPGSGKGTQARMLTQCLGIPHISTGDMLRDRIRHGSELGTAVVATMQSGALVSDDVVNLMVRERLSQPDAARGFVLDGYPRTLPQAEDLCKWLDGRGGDSSRSRLQYYYCPIDRTPAVPSLRNSV
jgi:adenylate kinase